MTPTPHGRLECVGLGMMLGAHLTPRAKHCIEEAQVVFVLASDGLVQEWVRGLRPDARSLQPYYADGVSRQASYAAMVAAILDEVRAGQRVCAAFYGHPGVFAQVSHDAIAAARREGLDASMQPGISAEDCLVADLGIDPGRYGCQHHEATQFLCTRRRVDTAAYLVLWQVATVGDRGFTCARTGPGHRQLLVERLLRDYPPHHEVILYEAATVAIETPRMAAWPLQALADARIDPHTTLVVPPAVRPLADRAMHARLDALEAAAERAAGRRRLVLVPSPAAGAPSD